MTEFRYPRTDFRYPPQAVRTIRANARTMSAAAIAAFMGCEVSMIEQICRKHGIQVRDKDFGNPGADPEKQLPEREAVLKVIRIKVDESVFRIVKREASRRNVNMHTLVEHLIERIAE